MTDGLQFDKVEPGSPGQGLVCAACKSPLTGEYFAARDVKVCAGCRAVIEKQVGAGPTPAQLAVAAGAGIAAAAVIDFVYLSFLSQGMGESIVALFSGMIVGFAVRKGSGNRGGRICQAIAMVLTYLMVVGAFYADFQRGELKSVLHWLIAPVASGQIWTTVLTGFGLYEAWRINYAPRLDFHGPFTAGGKATNG
jgi:hypothetical protein